MYSRAPRDTLSVNSQTTRNVGPATYAISDGLDYRVNVVPFLSSKKRVPSFLRKPATEVYYGLPDTITSVKGGSTPRNKALRFVTQISDTPAPGDYDPQIEVKCRRDVPSTVRPRKLYVCRVPYSTKVTAPSMPLDPYGYSLNKNASLSKIHPAETDTTLGPAYYHVPFETINPNKGCKWSGRTGKRSFYNVEESPGPAAYDLVLPKCRKSVEEEQTREMARRFSFVPRYLEMREMKLWKEGLPGPGQYDVCNRDVCKMCESAKPRPFVSAAKRFNMEVSENPGPGHYDTSKDISKYPVSKRQVPFSVEAQRGDSTKQSDSPGPAYYYIPSPLTERLMKKKNVYTVFEPPFCTTAKRNTLGISPDAASSPSPADYYKDIQGHCKIFVSSVFKSKTTRFKRVCKANEVSPASYDSGDAYKTSKGHTSFQMYETSFNSTSKRKGIIEVDDRPGPADYCSQGNLSHKGHYIPTSPRFPDSGSDVPGPGTYMKSETP
ncbi:hypothetical protein NQ315_003429 [Exocentrus adspersus]|uniref:Sperm-tail PG-rich repeat-containing protein 2 n=1 Tax=Exocentrus adspersus TaxID=1586481 RepID=A0AAV8VNH0_9CUCU|nr:hypothetical protein NQ315_003429 [Exocentrus adspersus]